jgi:DNA-binding response OmpR family regulator
MKRILFIEDDALVAGIYTQKLAEEGYEVVIAEDGLVAMRKLVDFKPGLVVLDLLLPKLNGVDVLDFMRQRADFKATPVVVLTNAYLSGLIEQAESLGVQASLLKSRATPADLVKVARNLLCGMSGAGPEPAGAPAAGSTPEAPTAPTSPAEAEQKESPDEFRGRIQREFIERIPIIFRGARQLCLQLVEAGDASALSRLLEDLSRKIGFLTQMTAMAGYRHFADLSGALEALLFELKEKPEQVTDSCRQTIISTVVFLAERLDRADLASAEDPGSSSILVVDDDAVTNRATVMALGRAKLDASSVTDPLEALALLKDNCYSLLLLDIKMPGMDGLTLCEQIRSLPEHRRTPVIFVTSLTDFKSRARAILSGGNDVITKPILPVELCVKVITHLLSSR